MKMINKDALIKDLKEAICKVTFRKVMTGELVDMRCTLHESVLPEAKGKGKRETPGLINVWDLDQEGWRSFYIQNVKDYSIEEYYSFQDEKEDNYDDTDEVIDDDDDDDELEVIDEIGDVASELSLLVELHDKTKDSVNKDIYLKSMIEEVFGLAKYLQDTMVYSLFEGEE